MDYRQQTGNTIVKNKQLKVIEFNESCLVEALNCIINVIQQLRGPSNVEPVVEKHTKYYVLIALGESIDLIKKHQKSLQTELLRKINLEQLVSFGQCLNGISPAREYPIKGFSWLRDTLIHGDKVSNTSWLSFDPIEVYGACGVCFGYFIDIVKASRFAVPQVSQSMQHQLPDPQLLAALRYAQPITPEQPCIAKFKQIIGDIVLLSQQNMQQNVPLAHIALHGASMMLANFYVQGVPEKRIVVSFIEHHLYPNREIPKGIFSLFDGRGNKTRNSLIHFITAEPNDFNSAIEKLIAVSQTIQQRLQEVAVLSTSSALYSSSYSSSLHSPSLTTPSLPNLSPLSSDPSFLALSPPSLNLSKLSSPPSSSSPLSIQFTSAIAAYSSSSVSGLSSSSLTLPLSKRLNHL